MNEELDEYLKNVKNLISIWESTPRSIEVAKDLNLNLTFLKVLIGSERFDGLDAFCRYFRETSKYISQLEGTENEKKIEIL